MKILVRIFPMCAARAVGFFLLMLTLWQGAPALLAQQAAETRVIPLGVYDREGRFVEELTPEQIRVKGVRGATVRRLVRDTGPRRIILLLDMSGSMGIERIIWGSALRTAKEVVFALQPDDRVALHAFADDHRVLNPFTQNFELVVRQLEALPEPGSKEAKKSLRGQSVLSRALEQILSKHDRQPLFDQAVVIVSDGGQVYRGDISLNELTNRVVAAGLRIFLLVAPPSQNWGEVPTGEMSMGEFIKRTGGTRLDPRKATSITPPGTQRRLTTRAERIRAMVRSAYHMIRHVYRVELESQEPLKKRRKLKLEVLNEQGRRMKKLNLLYPRYLTPLPAPP